MTRIVAGDARGRRLAVPSAGTRPTADRVREAMFSAIDARIDLRGARVLDLFAGSGALGLEALSRGAEAVTLVESAPRAAAVIGKNIAAVGLPGARVLRTAAAAAIANWAGEPLDVVLADPPYDIGDDEVTALLAALASGGLLSEGALVVLERPAKAPGTVWPEALEPGRVRRYGDTRIEIATCYRAQS